MSEDHVTAAKRLATVVRRGGFGGSAKDQPLVMSLSGSLAFSHRVGEYVRFDGTLRESHKQKLRNMWVQAFPEKPYPQQDDEEK